MGACKTRNAEYGIAERNKNDGRVRGRSLLNKTACHRLWVLSPKYEQLYQTLMDEYNDGSALLRPAYVALTAQDRSVQLFICLTCDSRVDYR